MTKIETKLIDSGRDNKYTHGAINPVIQRASSIIFNSIEQQRHLTIEKKNNDNTLYYGRYGTLTHFSLQQSMIELENGAGCTLYPSGTAAITHSILAFIRSGDHILITSAAYEPTQKFCRHIANTMNVSVTWFNPLIGKNIVDLIQNNTRIIMLESPSSITMEVQDIPEIVKQVRKKKPEIVILLDNTWSAGVFLKALNMGVDISIQSGSKYIIGHSDGMLGTAVSNNRCWQLLKQQSYLMGQIIDSDTAYMASRGLRTLHVRLKEHEKNGLYVAHWLSNHPFVKQVNHPALSTCKGHKYFVRDFSGSSGLFSFILKKHLTTTQVTNFINYLKHFKIAYSWGGFESLILIYQPEEIASIHPQNKPNFTETLVRIHVGLENPQDLIHDLSCGFDRVLHLL